MFHAYFLLIEAIAWSAAAPSCLISLIHKFVSAIRDSRLRNIEKQHGPQCVHPGRNDIAADLHITSIVVSTLTVRLYVLGIAIGPIFMPPLSEMYGRVPVTTLPRPYWSPLSLESL
jgi:hypothetical protein